MRQHEPSWKSAIHARQWAQTLEDFAYPVIGLKAPGEVSTADIVAILKPRVKRDGPRRRVGYATSDRGC